MPSVACFRDFTYIKVRSTFQGSAANMLLISVSANRFALASSTYWARRSVTESRSAFSGAPLLFMRKVTRPMTAAESGLRASVRYDS